MFFSTAELWSSSFKQKLTQNLQRLIEAPKIDFKTERIIM